MEAYDDFGRFVLGAEQLGVCRELLLSDSTPKQRMAVILLDSLADALLYRLMKTTFLYSDRAWFNHLLPLYSKKKRERARMYFAERLKIARDPSYATVVAGYPAVVTEADITVLTIGHSYRNAAYHRDAHNPAVLATIGKLFFKSVSVLFVNAQPQGVKLYITKGQANRLRSIGIDLGSGHSETRLNYHDAASNLTSFFNNGMEITVPKLAQELAEDLEFRVQDVKDGINYLREAPGDIDDNLEWIEFWASHRADEELMLLKDERDIFRHDIRNMDLAHVTPEMREKEVQFADAYNKRFWALWQTRGNAARGAILNNLTNIEKVAARLSMKKSSARILQEYRKADERLNVIEEHVSEAVAAYDEGIP